MDVRKQMEAAVALDKERRAANAEHYEDDSKRQLLDVVHKKMDTAFIGAIAQFEEAFGHAWGHGKLPAELDEVERYYRNVWETCRNAILTNGNGQKRAVAKEFNQYKVVWERFKSTFLPRN